MTARYTVDKLLVPLVVALVVLAGAAGTVAADPLFGGTVVVAEGDTVNGLETVAGTVIVRGTVEGDLAGTAGTIVIERTGVVTGAVSAATGSLRVSGEVRGDVSVGAGSVTVDRTGVVLGEFSVGAGSVLIDGRIAGPAVVGADTITVGSTAVLEQGLRYDAGTLDVAPGASVTGEVVRDESLSGVEFTPVVFEVPDLVVFAYGVVVNLVLGAILLVVFPGASRRVADLVAEDPLRSAGYGLGALVLVPVALVVVAVTIVGIPITVVGAILFAFAVWVALVYGRFAVAAWALSRFDVTDRWAALVVGVVGLGILATIPFLGGLLDFVVVLLGLGALATVLLEARRSRRGPVADTEQTTFDDVDGRPA